MKNLPSEIKNVIIMVAIILLVCMLSWMLLSPDSEVRQATTAIFQAILVMGGALLLLFGMYAFADRIKKKINF